MTETLRGRRGAERASVTGDPRFTLLAKAVCDGDFRREDLRVLAALLGQTPVTLRSGIVTCRASRFTLALISGVHDASIVRATKRLEAAGVVRKRPTRGKHATTYELLGIGANAGDPTEASNPGTTAWVEESTDARVKTANPGTGARQYLEAGAPSRDTRSQSIGFDVQSEAATVADELESNPQQEESASAAESRFAEFWALYPRKEAKPAAERAWGRGRLKSHAEVILADLRARIADPEMWQSSKYTPLPATYLNDKRWRDEWKRSKPAAGAVALDARSDDEIEAANWRELARVFGDHGHG